MSVVAIGRCRSYSETEVGPAVENLFGSIIGGRTKDMYGRRVLVKPNLLAARKPSRGVTTHPVIVGCIIDYLKAHGAIVSVGDSPAGALRGVRRVWEICGMLEVCEAKGVPLVNFEASGPVVRSVDGRTYHVARAPLEADYVVSVAKFKTHVLTLLTGAIKNMFGCVPGFRKSALHLENPRPHPMSRAIVDVFSLVPPWLSVVDGVVAMDGNGPSSGRLRDLGFLAAGSDCVALDAALAAIAGIDPMRVPTTAEACRRGLGEGRLERVEFPLLRPEEVAPADFRIPGSWKYALIPGFAGRILGSLLWIKPVIAADVCTGCGECADVCPTGAIAVDDNKAAVNRGLCISCLCCHEACPAGAVKMRKSRLARLIS